MQPYLAAILPVSVLQIRDLSAWNVSNVTSNFSTSEFNGDLSAWNVSQVTNMSTMLARATSFNGDLGAWNVFGVTTMYQMFGNASASNGDLSAWEVFGGHMCVRRCCSVQRRPGCVEGLRRAYAGMWRRRPERVERFWRLHGDLSAWNVPHVTIMHVRGGCIVQRRLGCVERLWQTVCVLCIFEDVASFNGALSAWNVSGRHGKPTFYERSDV